LNPHALAGTSPSSWRVCLFRHSDVAAQEAFPPPTSEEPSYRGPTTPPNPYRTEPAGGGSPPSRVQVDRQNGAEVDYLPVVPVVPVGALTSTRFTSKVPSSRGE
jgi:hypothetical protein